MKINKLLTKVNYTKGNNRKIEFITIHFVGSTGSAEQNCRYFENENRGASAHYFVNFDGAIWQSVEDKDVAWHCGAKSYKHPKCRNNNSIGIEMCCRKDKNGKWYFEEETISSTIALTQSLMDKYNIPIENVIRHYDVTGKICPEPYVRDASAWQNFLDRLGDTMTQEQFNQMMEQYLADLAQKEPSNWSKEARNYAEATGLIKGDENGNRMYKKFVTREELATIIYRMNK